MAVALDASSVAAKPGSASFTHNHTCTGSQLYVLAAVTIRSTNSVTGTPTCGATSMTQLVRKVEGTDVSLEVWGCVPPATGSNTLSFGLSGSTDAVIGVSSFTGVDPAAPYGTVTSGSGTGAISLATNGTTTGMFFLVVGALTSGTLTLTTSGATQRFNQVCNSTLLGVGATAPGAASITDTWDRSLGTGWSQVGVPLLQYVATLPKGTLSMMGAGK